MVSTYIRDQEKEVARYDQLKLTMLGLFALSLRHKPGAYAGGNLLAFP